MREKGEDSIQQAEIIDRTTNKIEMEGMDRNTSLRQGVETSRKIALSIQHMITKENVLIVT